MLPDAHHLPAVGAEQPVLPAVALFVIVMIF
jgi:hypothetical protein